ncbi:MAG TPA: 3-ketoacyl-ACP reductase [Opitutaceae bacterium]|nr:3-ketoacyl-ACP reductase [Opitutaceae bacterium]
MPHPSGNLPVILVTGASRGLGRGMARELAAEGYSVAINYAANQAAAAETAGLCRAAAKTAGQKFIPVQADLRSGADRTRLLQEVLAQFGRLDGLVNNAGVAPEIRADILEATEESFVEVVRTNLQGPYFLTQLVARHWLTDKPAALLPGGFKIVFITSISADTASVMRGEYCISKAGLAMSAQLWAARLASAGIQVVELRPGLMATDMTAGVKRKYDALIADGLIPQMRWGTPEDVGRAVRSVMAGNFSFSTGAVIAVDGGFSIRRL